MFSPDQFLDMPIEGSNDTKIVPVPVGEYTAVAEDVKVRQWQAKDDPSKSGLALDIVWSIDDAGLRELFGREKITCKQGIMLDLTDSGSIDMGKGRNIGLGRLREALSLNEPGQPFSFTMILGRLAKVSIKHRVHEEDVFAEVKSIAKFS